jgi:hypothetical protein
MSVLMVNDWIDFTEMKALLNTTDGNLASHSSSLEKIWHRNKKKLCKTKTSYRVNMGRAAFVSHLNSLEKLFKS